MAYQRGAKRSVSRFVSAGYTDESELYIEKTRAGSAADRLRDLNRRGYAAKAEAPDPVLEFSAARPQLRRNGAAAVEKESFAAYWIRSAREDRGAAMLCALLLCAVVFLGCVWGAKGVKGAQNRSSIEAFNTATVALIRENEALAAKLQQAQNGERIRNRAQNELGMLRRERAKTEKIYIQLPEDMAASESEAAAEPRFEFLDVMLGLLEMLHIGG
ncbi:MAG: hypothetical protein IJ573_08170 [Clostridia bacterium]|nr:hypothetical protein [Clostridia bacterium]